MIDVGRDSRARLDPGRDNPAPTKTMKPGDIMLIQQAKTL
jgi:hypothetical protein